MQAKQVPSMKSTALDWMLSGWKMFVPLKPDPRYASVLEVLNESCPNGIRQDRNPTIASKRSDLLRPRENLTI